MLKLKSLRFSGIGRFVEPQEIDFASLGSLVQIDGENRNTNGSSGSGKSTVFNTLDYLLGLNDLPTTVLQSRLTKEKLSVTGEFDWDGKQVRITRAAKLSIEIDGITTTGSAVLTEAKLDEILGMPRDIFRKILHKRQKEGGFFLDFTPKKMYEFLTDALNLVAERKKLEKVDLKLSDLEKKKIAGQTQVLNLQSSLKATQESILALGLPPIKDIHQSVILELKGKYDVSTKRFQEVEEKHRSETQELEKQRPIVSVVAYDSSAKESIENRRKELGEQVNKLNQVEAQRISGIRSRISELNLEKSKLDYQVSEANSAQELALETANNIKKIRSAMCPTCERPDWVTETANIRENELLSKLLEYKEKITVGVKAKQRQIAIIDELLIINEQIRPVESPELPQIRDELSTLEQRLKEEKAKESDHLNTQNVANSSKLQHFATLQQELKSNQELNSRQFRGQVEVDRMAFESAVNKLKNYNDAVIRYESAAVNMKTNESSYLEQLTKAQSQLEITENEILMAEVLKKGVKEFISCSFDDALASVGDAATKIIRCIPTMSNATIQFEGQKTTQDGKIKEEVNAVISVDGEIGIPIKSLSGGERSSVDLAVDLAVIDFVELKSAKGIDVFILDEPFTGLDTVSIEMALEVLKNSNTNKKLIVVDHNPEVKQMVSNRIVVVREGTTSTIAG